MKAILEVGEERQNNGSRKNRNAEACKRVGVRSMEAEWENTLEDKKGKKAEKEK